ncbi:MAG TPA: hypothetical protein VIQ99_00890, partial [Gammaproteobacteria bacterium]
MLRGRWAILVPMSLLGLALAIPSPAAAQTDVVTLHNGDRLTGEIKSLDRGILFFDPPYSDTIQITWEHVATLV